MEKILFHTRHRSPVLKLQLWQKLWIRIHSELIRTFRIIPISVSERMRINPKQPKKKFSISIIENRLKLNPAQFENSIQTNQK